MRQGGKIIFFVKMQGLGNDFILIEAASWDEGEKYQSYAQFLCNRHLGVGADGLVVTGPDLEADIFMRIFNPDGTEAQMCGNALTCVVSYAHQGSFSGKRVLSIRTLAGQKLAEIIEQVGKLKKVRIDMGLPVFDLQMADSQGKEGNSRVKLEIDGQVFRSMVLSIGNLHRVVLVDHLDQIPVEIWGSKLERREMFPTGINVEFVQVVKPGKILMKVWERGAGLTLACGTGACAALVAAVLNNLAERQAIVSMPGGDLYIDWDDKTGHVFMSGEAVEVFRGEISIEPM